MHIYFKDTALIIDFSKVINCLWKEKKKKTVEWPDGDGLIFNMFDGNRLWVPCKKEEAAEYATQIAQGISDRRTIIVIKYTVQE